MMGRMGSVWGRKREVLLSLGIVTLAMFCAAGSCQQLGESPMSFSPDSRNLALTTLEPLHMDAGSFLAGPQAFRVMVVSEQKQLRVLEERTDALLTAPGYSPDGERVCYLRIPLLTEEQDKAQAEEVNQRLKPLEHAVSQPWTEWWGSGGQPKAPETQPTDTQPAASAGTQPASTQPAIDVVDAALPPVTGAFSPFVNTVFLPGAAAQVVVRDVRTGQVVSETPVELPRPNHQVVYMNTRPEFDPAGEWVYFATGQVVMAVKPATGEKRVVAGGSETAKLSPDGKTLAVYIHGGSDPMSVIGLISTDGQLALYRKVPSGISDSLTWIDNETLALLTSEREPAAASQPAPAPATQPDMPEVLVIQYLRRDGTLAAPARIVLPRMQDGKVSASGMAIAPDGRHMIVDNRLMTMDGRLVGVLQSDKEMSLREPTFSPDSRQVAFKVVRSIADKIERTEAVVFYSSEGKMLGQVAIPAIQPGTTKPASTTQLTATTTTATDERR